MKFIDESKMNSICSFISKNISDESWQDVSLTFSVHEVGALLKVVLNVYNEFCTDSDEDDGFSMEVNHFLDNLLSVYNKLNEAY